MVRWLVRLLASRCKSALASTILCGGAFYRQYQRRLQQTGIRTDVTVYTVDVGPRLVKISSRGDVWRILRRLAG